MNTDKNRRLSAFIGGLLLFTAVAQAAQPGWIDLVAPILRPAERKAYLALPAAARADFEAHFFSDKTIGAEEYFRRLQYVDDRFGSSKRTSGTNTDPGRVYLSLGAPTRITRLASSRIFVPMEIWYYDHPELRLIFYQQNSVGLMRLYSPTADTIRALLIPQAAIKGMFGPNDNITESDIRRKMVVGPAEDEVITAAAGVATGIRYSGNDEILGRITSPELMLSKAQETKVTTRFLASRPALDILRTASAYGGSQVDFHLRTTAQNEIDVEVTDGGAPIYQNQLHLRFSRQETVEYTHRLDLLPGSYRVIITIDGNPCPYAVEVLAETGMGEIFRARAATDVDHRSTPFEFEGKQFSLDPNGKLAAVAVARPGRVIWILRRGSEAVWRSVSDAQQIATVELPASLAPAAYRLEAINGSDSRVMEYVVKADPETTGEAAHVSFNANLDPAHRYAFVGHQQLLRGDPGKARESLRNSLAKGATEEAQIELARADALGGEFDESRARLRAVLTVHPNNFEALSVFAYIESRLQDYSVAAEMYRRALAVQDSPALRAALAKLPTK